jgi:transcriptional regulator with XRE-family HTH domain
MGNNDHIKQVGQNLLAAIEATTVSQAEFCRRFNVAPPKLGHWVKGRNYPDPYVMAVFCEVEGVTMDWIYRGRRAGVISSVADRLPSVAVASAQAPPAPARPGAERRARAKRGKSEAPQSQPAP